VPEPSIRGARAMAEPAITALVAVFNGEAFVGEALQSIRSQTRPPDRIVVVDDGSTDGTAAVVRGVPGVRYLHQANGGQASALNLGLRHVEGGFLCFLDADDLWPPDKLDLQLRAFEHDPALDMVFGQAEQFRQDDGSTDAPQPARVHGAMLIRTASFARVGELDTSYRIGTLLDWYARARELGLRERVLDEVVLRRRVHGDNTGVIHGGDRSAYLKIVKAALDRRRNRQDD